VSDLSPGPGWWLASDGRWYAPELRPAAPPAPLPIVGADPWGLSASSGYPVVPQGVPSQWPSADVAPGPRRIRPLAIALAVAVVLVATGLAAPFVRHGAVSATPSTVGASPAVTVPVPSTPPDALLGQHPNPLGLEENSTWREVTAKAKAGSRVAFGSVYGAYPPTGLPSTRTFLVVAAEPTGGISDIPEQLRQQINEAQSAVAGVGAGQISTLPVQASILNGELSCVGFTSDGSGFGECLWMDSATVVLLTTFSNDLQVVKSATEQVVEALHAPTASV
jgi:hypothetical protein